MASSTIGDRIKEARERAGMTQGQLALALGATSHMTVSRWERGEYEPERRWLSPLARELGVSLSWLIEGEEPGAVDVPSPELPEEVLALCDALGVARPSEAEARWLLAEPEYHRRKPVAIVDVLRTHRQGLAIEREITEAYRDPAVPRRRK